MKKVLFIFDRVAHYHQELFKRLEQVLPTVGLELILLSGETDQPNSGGRTGLSKRVIEREAKFAFREYRISSLVLRRHFGVMQHVQEIQPHIIVVLSHVGNLSHWQLMRLKEKLGFKLVAWQCGYEYNPGRLKDMLLRRFIPRFDHHLAYHTNARDYALRHGARQDQVAVMHNTVNEERIPVLSRAEARLLIAARHPSVGDRQIVLFVGAILVEKRIEIILRALDHMKRNDVVLLVVGDGDHMQKVRQHCDKRDDVLLTGAIVEEVGPYFDAATLYVLPGTGGLGINEAMAHGLPVVAGYADGSADDLVVDGENGFRLRENTPEELAEKMGLILDNSLLAQRMGARSRELITGKFAFRQFVGRIVGELSTLAA